MLFICVNGTSHAVENQRGNQAVWLLIKQFVCRVKLDSGNGLYRVGFPLQLWDIFVIYKMIKIKPSLFGSNAFNHLSSDNQTAMKTLTFKKSLSQPSDPANDHWVSLRLCAIRDY